MKYLFLVIFFFTFNLSVFGDENSSKITASFKIKNPSDLINALAQKLINDPSQSSIKNELFSYLNQASIAPVVLMKITAIRDLFDLNERLVSRREYFQDKLKILKDQLLKSGVTLRDINLYEIAVPHISQKFVHRESSDYLFILHQMLVDQREEILSDIVILEKQMTQLRQYQKPKEITIVSNDVESSWRENNNNVSDINVLRREVEDLKEQVANLEFTLNEKQSKIDQMSKQIVDLSLEFSQREINLNKGLQQVDAVNSSIENLESRLEFSQRIIKEKDDAILEVKNKVRELEEKFILEKKNFAEALTVKESQVNETQGILSIYKEQLKEKSNQFENQRRLALDLNSKLEEIKRIYSKREGDIEIAKTSVALLSQSLDDLEYRIQNEGLPNIDLLLEQISSLKENLKNIETSL